MPLLRQSQPVQVAASVIVTAILTPLLTTWMYKCGQEKRTAEAAARGDVYEGREAAKA